MEEARPRRGLLVAAAIVIGAVALITMSRGEPPAEPDCV